LSVTYNYYDIIVNIPTDNALDYNFKKANYEIISRMLHNADWSYLYNESNINKATEFFYKSVFDIIKVNITKKNKRRRFTPPWFSLKFRELLKKKKVAHRKLKNSGDNKDHIHFSYLRALCKKKSRLCYSLYLTNIQNSLIKNPRSFWNYIKNSKTSSNFPNSISYEGKLSDKPLDIANLFSNYFGSVYKKPNFVNPSSLYHIEDLVYCSNITISVEEVFDALSNLGFETCSGPNMLPPILINNYRYALAKPTHYLFSLSLKAGKFPLKWKSSFITPIWKSGDRSNINNYRPISKLSTLPKLFEKLIVPQISKIFSNILMNEQHGFRSEKSITTNLLVYYTFLAQEVSCGKQVDVVYTVS
jgi:hypothetical protein